MKTVLVASMLGLLLACAAPAKPRLLARLVHRDASVRRTAEKEWKALDADSRFWRLLPGLRSKDPEIAWICADRLDPERLTLDEHRIRARLFARHPEHYLMRDGRGKADLLCGLGRPEVPELLRNFARIRTVDPERPEKGPSAARLAKDIGDLHRMMAPEHLPVLVSCLPAEDPFIFREIASLLACMSMWSDEHRTLVAQGLLYALARIEVEKHGEPVPPLASFVVDAPGSRLPDAFRTIAARAFFPARWVEGEPIRIDPDQWWTLRWARELTPGRDDVPFLTDLVTRCKMIGARAWAVESLVRLDDPRAKALLDGIRRGDSLLAPFVLAARGDRSGLRARFGSRHHEDYNLALALARMPELFAGSSDPAPYFELSELAALEGDFGIRIPHERIGRLPLGWGMGDDDGWQPPSLMDGAAAESLDHDALEAHVAQYLARPFVYGEDRTGSLESTLEVRAPDVLIRLLEAAVKQESEDPPVEALRTLARLGDDRHLDRTIELIPTMLGEDAWNGVGAALDLGGLRHPRVEAALRTWARREDPEEALAALWGLCVMKGADRRMLPVHTFEEPDFGADPWSRWRRMVLDGDPIGMLIDLHKREPQDELCWLGLSTDPRVRPFLEQLRTERRRYWPATAGLALLGDDDAKAEIRGFIRDNRAIFVTEFENLLLPGMDADPALIDVVIDRVAHSCCASCDAIGALTLRYPTLDARGQSGHLLERRRQVRAWYDRNRTRLVWSEIAEGYIPR